MMMLPFLSSFLLCAFLTWGFSKLFRKLGFLDEPERFGYQRLPIPYGVGIVFFFTFLILGLFFLELTSKVFVLFLSTGALTMMCFLDDRFKLSPFLRFGIQIFLAALVVLAGVQVPAISNPFGDPVVLDHWKIFSIAPFAALVAMIWIVFVTNAMNWLDGAPGIVSGVSTIASLVIFFLAAEKNIHVIDQSTLSTMALIGAGSSFAFLFFDFPPPRVLMGDSGTMFLGFMLASMAIFSGAKFATVFIVLAIPLFDALWTIGRRIIQKKSPFHGDFEHLHHDLLRKGLSERQVNFLYFAISLSFGLSALWIGGLGKLITIIFLFVIMLTIRLILLRKI